MGERTRGGRSLSHWAALCVAIGLVLAPTVAGASEFSDKNHPEYWEDLGYGTCVKYEKPGTPYVLGPAPAGTTWSMLVVKAGSESSTNDPHAEYPSPVPGSYYHPSGKSISHVIVCSRRGSTTTTTTTSTPDGCGTYTPRALAVDKASVEAGESVTITGTAGTVDQLTFTIGGVGVTTRTLGTTTSAADGSFSMTVVVPDDYPAGRFTITVTSASCGRTGTITITTQSVNRSGCGANAYFTLERGSTVTWTMIPGTPPFNTAKPVSLKLNQRTSGGATYTLYTGGWPSGGTVTFTVPAAAPLDRYYLVQAGRQKGNNRPRTESCPLRVVDPPPPAPAEPLVEPTTIQTTGAAMAGALLLLQLRRRRRRSARRALR